MLISEWSDLIRILPLVLYAETHFRLPGLFSLLYKKQPEILVDVPHRLQQGQDLPVLLLIKDSHRFPILLETLTVRIAERTWTYALNEPIDRPLWHRLFHLQKIPAENGRATVEAVVHARINGRRQVIHSDNFNRAGHEPFAVQVDEEPLPGSERCLWTDLHCHSNYTDNQVEFGPPLPALLAMAKAIGLGALAVTDHSFDLDDRADDYLTTDAELGKWRALHEEVQALNEVNEIKIICGEEVSVGNRRGKNVHLLILNDPMFYPGSGDSGENWPQIRPQEQAAQVLRRLSPQAAAFAAHPEAQPPWPQRLVLGRARWSTEDYAVPGLHGLQIWNGEAASGWRAGLPAWVQQLLAGRRLAIIGGNDSHGDFNRVRHIRVPFWSILESTHHVFGAVRTGLYGPPPQSIGRMVSALQTGRCLVSNGPFAQLWVDGRSSGETVLGSGGAVKIVASSSAHFGFLNRVELIIGDCQKKQEVLRLLAVPPACHHFEIELTDQVLPDRGYVRLQVMSDIGGRRCRCLTNPVYLDVKTV